MFVTAYHTYIRTRPTTPTFIFGSGKETETWRTKKLVIVVVVVVGFAPAYWNGTQKEILLQLTNVKDVAEKVLSPMACVFFLLELIALLVELFLGLVSVGGVQLIKGGCFERTSRGSWFLCGANCRQMETDLESVLQNMLSD